MFKNKIVEGDHKTWPKLSIGRFFFGPGHFFGQQFLSDQKSNVFFGCEWLTPSPFIFFKNYVMAKVTCALHKVRVSVFGMGTGFDIDALVIAKIAKFPNLHVWKMGRNFYIQKCGIFRCEKMKMFCFFFYWLRCFCVIVSALFCQKVFQKTFWQDNVLTVTKEDFSQWKSKEKLFIFSHLKIPHFSQKVNRKISTLFPGMNMSCHRLVSYVGVTS